MPSGSDKEYLACDILPLRWTATLPVGQEAEVADADEAARQQVEQEAAEELIERQSQHSLLVGMCRVTPAEGDGIETFFWAPCSLGT
jgi:hypothetical protein